MICVAKSTYVRQTRYDVGAAAVIVAKFSAGRTSLLISNTGATTLSIGTRENLAVGQGVELLPGGTFSLTERDDFALVQYEWVAISSGAAGTLEAWETILAELGDY